MQGCAAGEKVRVWWMLVQGRVCHKKSADSIARSSEQIQHSWPLPQSTAV